MILNYYIEGLDMNQIADKTDCTIDLVKEVVSNFLDCTK